MDRAGSRDHGGPFSRPSRARLVRYLQDVSSRPGPHDLRASDSDRERVVALLTEAAGDGRLTLGEHAERAEQAYAARTLGELAVLTADLATPSAQPIRLDTRRAVAAMFGKERREGRWVVPDNLAVTAIFGEVVLDLREALLQTSQITLFATIIGGTLQLIVPEGVAVVMTGTSILTRRTGNGSVPSVPGMPEIEIRALAIGGRVKTIVPRRPRRRWALRRGESR
jgi:DUF1707 SHOCT-like domain